MSDTLSTLDLLYFDGLENEEGDYRPIFIPNACHVCKAMHNKESTTATTTTSTGKSPETEVKVVKRLLSCSGCKLIAYCGSEHQKQHWSEHKEFCKAVQKILRQEGRKSIFYAATEKRNQPVSAENWKSIRYNWMVRLEHSLSRPMLPYEREMLLYPRVCSTCYTDEGSSLSQCPQCQSVFYCCEQHKPACHSEFCRDLQLLLELNIEQATKGRVECLLPHQLLEKYEEFPASLKEFLVMRMIGVGGALASGKLGLATLTEFASYPMTIVWALQEAAKVAQQREPKIPPLEERKSLVIHIVGAELPFECNNLPKWDVFLLNILPALRSLYIVFTGPELQNVPAGAWDEDMRCPHCLRNDKSFVIDFQPNTLYHEYVQGKSYIRPDVIVAYNCGLYRETGYQGSDSWAGTLPYLLKEGVPLILTAYTAAEAPLDLKRLQESCPLEILLPPSKNPYRSLRPCRNFVSEEESPVIFKNQYITVVRKGV